jgi:hypothetical protein
MAKSDIPQTMMEGLQSLLPDIASIMAAPDADMDFLDKLQKIVLLRIHKPSPQQPGAGGAPPAPPAGATGGGPEAAPASGLPGGGSPGGPPGGGAPNPQMPSMGPPNAPTGPGGVTQPMNNNPDEMRRVIAEAAGR